VYAMGNYATGYWLPACWIFGKKVFSFEVSAAVDCKECCNRCFESLQSGGEGKKV